MSAEQTLKDQIIQKAWEDAAFKKELLANPKTAIRDAFGIEVPDTIEIEIVEESAKKYYLVLPQSPEEVEANSAVYAPTW